VKVIPAPDTGGHDLRDELRPDAGTQVGLWLSVRVISDGALVAGPVFLVQAPGLAVERPERPEGHPPQPTL
jgi:hypothetical protein